MNTEIAVPSHPVYAVGTEVWFHPAITTLNIGHLQDHALRAKVMSVNIRSSGHNYDLALDVSTSHVGDYYAGIPIACVDASFVRTKEHLLEANGLADSMVAVASSMPPAQVRKFARRYQEIQADLPNLRRELGRV